MRACVHVSVWCPPNTAHKEFFGASLSMHKTNRAYLCVCVAPDMRQNNDITTPLFFFLLSAASETKESESQTAFPLSLALLCLPESIVTAHMHRGACRMRECVCVYECVPESLERLQVESIMLLLFIHAQCQKNEALGKPECTHTKTQCL